MVGTMINQQSYSPYRAAAVQPVAVASMFGNWRTRMSGADTRAADDLSEQTTTRPFAFTGRMVNPKLRASPTVARADRPDPWRADMGGHDPATPMAEALINYHNHAVAWMVPIVFMVGHMCRHFVY
eukprot:GHVS01010434.1.p1 GENE.GHVS01010434.1~~GHVS01010434.1.p1  ORF type:complete len:126 (+),score=7.14 GHVS01010434.1:79-456(+)